MHLKSLTLKGFKSFPDRTRLVFAPGVSVVVGPNGSGKSNITDAVLWALGEQSPLAVRGQSMQDVIFAGGHGHTQRRSAEVEVVIENSDGRAPTEFSEISITRRLDRSGDGEYRLNGARCRLADVIEALSDTGLGKEMHSVISQGRVEAIVLSKPRDRRLLIEEAAGLGKHRKRRRRAQLKLARTQDNLDRALDVEREARTRLRPLKRQAEAADLHARLERQALELRSRLVADSARTTAGELADAERAAAKARKARDAVDAELGEVAKLRESLEERFAERDRERARLWSRLTGLRTSHERLDVRGEALAGRTAELEPALARLREALAASAAERRAGGDRLEVELNAVEEALDAAAEALAEARALERGPEQPEALARVRGSAEEAIRAARRAERLAGGSPEQAAERRLAAGEALVAEIERLSKAIIAARDAVAEQVSVLQERAAGDERGGEETASELRECSRREYEIQARLRQAGEAVTVAEVTAAQIRDRREQAGTELTELSKRLGLELEPAAEPLADGEREDIERKLERLARRREQLGPVNPLAQREYEEAVAHVEELETQRHDLESALAELQALIRDTDRKIRESFEQTFEATARNFEEVIQHLFPGGRGALRLVEDEGPKKVIGGAEPPAEDDQPAGDAPWANAESTATPAEASSGDDESEEPIERDPGVEVEVTPAGKATKRLSLLSGGEKSLVALAFMFAVFLARPCPFYILDEVEAALDDANIDRFLQLVRRFSDRAQFIIVTHQKRTMDAADVLYGVSMGTDGVTKVASRRLPPEQEQDEGGEAPDVATAA